LKSTPSDQVLISFRQPGEPWQPLEKPAAAVRIKWRGGGGGVKNMNDAAVRFERI